MFTRSGILAAAIAASCLLAAAHVARAGEEDPVGIVFPTESVAIEGGTGPSLVWSTYLGSSSDHDYSDNIRLSPSGDVLVLGYGARTWPMPNSDTASGDRIARISPAGELLSTLHMPVDVLERR